MKIIIKLLLLLSFVIAEHNYHRCGFGATNNETRITRPSLDSHLDDGFFRIHYDKAGPDAPELGYEHDAQPYPDDDQNGHPDYIDAVAAAANYSYNVMVTDLNYNEQGALIISDCALSDDCENLGGNSLYDIYVVDLKSECKGDWITEYGSNEPSDGSIERSTFIKIDNGMTETCYDESTGEKLGYHTNGIDAVAKVCKLTTESMHGLG